MESAGGGCGSVNFFLPCSVKGCQLLFNVLIKEMRKGIGGHQSAKSRTDEWITPPNIIRAIGLFDLDPCSPISRPWDTARNHFSLLENGLQQGWFGKIWLNPPYGRDAERWLNKLSDHGDGVALIFARTETEMFFSHVWPKASALLFIKGRLHFYTVQGKRAKANAGAPSILIAYGKTCADLLEQSNIPGKFIRLKW